MKSKRVRSGVIRHFRLGDKVIIKAIRRTKYDPQYENKTYTVTNQKHCGQSITAYSMRLLFTFSPGRILRSVCLQFIAYKDNT